MKKCIHYLLLIGVTAFPGVQKLVILLFIKQQVGYEELGRFVNDTFIVQIFSFVTSLNWATFVMTDVPKLSDSDGKRYFASLSNHVFITSTIALLPLVGLAYTGWIVDFSGSAVYLIGWSYYQFWRHYYLAKHKYKWLAWIDAISLVIQIGLLFLSEIYSLLYITLSGVFLGVYPTLVLLSGHGPETFRLSAFNPCKSLNRTWKSLYQAAIELAISNGLTGVIPLFFAPLSFNLLEPAYAGLIGIINNLSSIALLFPRAIAYYYLPKLSESINYDLALFSKLYMKYQRSIQTCLFIFFFISIPVFIAYTRYQNISLLPMTYELFLAIMCAAMVSQLALPSSNVLVVVEEQRTLLIANLFSFVCFISIFLTIIYTISNGFTVLFTYLVINLIFHLGRTVYLNRVVQNKLRQLEVVPI